MPLAIAWSTRSIISIFCPGPPVEHRQHHPRHRGAPPWHARPSSQRSATTGTHHVRLGFQVDGWGGRIPIPAKLLAKYLIPLARRYRLHIPLLQRIGTIFNWDFGRYQTLVGDVSAQAGVQERLSVDNQPAASHHDHRRLSHNGRHKLPAAGAACCVHHDHRTSSGALRRGRPRIGHSEPATSFPTAAIRS